MTEKAQRQDGEEAREDREILSADVSRALTPEDATSEAEQTDAAVESTRKRRPTRKATVAPTSASETVATEGTDVAAMSAIEADKIELEAQGFTPDEAERLIEMSKRLETSAEARASQAELKRLRFAQWLIERGILDEFSV